MLTEPTMNLFKNTNLFKLEAQTPLISNGTCRSHYPFHSFKLLLMKEKYVYLFLKIFLFLLI
jgi:hypothetical protein